MKPSNEIIEKAIRLAKDPYREYEVIAIRVQEVPFEFGEMEHVSKVWIDGYETEECLDGVCGTLPEFYMTKSIINQLLYYGDHIAIIGGNNYSYGEDSGEVIIQDAVVLEIFS